MTASAASAASAPALRGCFECVANVSEGRDRTVVDSLASACGAALLDVHTDPDHHRSVLTLGGRLETVERGIRTLARRSAELLDVGLHRGGVHPRLGALDVVPFVALDPGDRQEAAEAAHRFAGWMGGTLAVPVFLYDDADPQRRSLPEARAEAFAARPPDFGPARPHATMGAAAVGARDPLVAVNFRLDRDDLDLARRLARRIRERDGGLPGVRALGFRLDSRAAAQVSANLVDLERTGLEAACAAVRDAARAERAEVAAVELVGLLPAVELERCSPELRAWAGLGDGDTVEARLARAGALS